MKRISLLAIVGVFLLGSHARAGDLLAFGLKGGIANNWVVSSLSLIDENKEPYLGWQAGAYARVNLPIIMGIKGELLYTKKGYDYELLGTKASIRTDFVEIPLLLSFGVIGKIEFDIGPQFSFRVSESIETDPSSNVNFDDTYPELSSTEIGLAIGADVNIIKRLGAYLRYTYGFNNTFEVLGEEQKISNQTLQLGVKLRIMN